MNKNVLDLQDALKKTKKKKKETSLKPHLCSCLEDGWAATAALVQTEGRWNCQSATANCTFTLRSVQGSVKKGPCARTQQLNNSFHLFYYCSLKVVRPGVIQLESKRASVGSTSPLSRAFFILSSASLADLQTNMWKTLFYKYKLKTGDKEKVPWVEGSYFQ